MELYPTTNNSPKYSLRSGHQPGKHARAKCKHDHRETLRDRLSERRCFSSSLYQWREASTAEH